MSRQLLFTAVACGLAACVLIATLVLSPAVSKPEIKERPILDPNAKFQPGPDPSNSTVATPQTITPSGVVERYTVRRFNEARQQLTILSGEKARPKPNGVVEIEKIIAHIHLIPGRRVVEIQAPRGMLVAPDNIPESGTLTGGVIITLYESPENQIVQLAPDSPDASLRLYLDDEVKFDLELGTVESQGPIHLTSPRVDFQGTGLSLIYNERRRRINRLEISQGKTMRFNPKAGRELTSSTSGKSDKNRSLIADYYKATLHDQVQVDAQQATIKTKMMEILFSLENRNQSEAPVKEIGWSPFQVSQRVLAAAWATSSASAVSTQTAPTTAVKPTSRSMMKPSVEDVTIAWQGVLLMEPLDVAPPELAGPDDTMITLIEDVEIVSAQKETITAQRVDYLSSAARVRVYGDTLTPALIQAPQLGKLQVIDFVVHQNEGTGKITGPGSIVTLASPLDKPETTRGKLPQGLSLKWNEGADFTFHVKKTAEKKAHDAEAPAQVEADNLAKRNTNPTLNPVAKLDALKHAVFHGTVKVEHPQVDLRTDKLSIAMAEPAQGKQDPQEIIATGHVNATARSSGEQPPLDLETDELTIRFTSDGKSKAQPTQLVASGNVKTKQGERRLSAGTLDVALVESKATADGKPGSDRLTIERLLAQKDVQVTASSPPMLVKADKLDGNAVTGNLHLYGTGEVPAFVQRESNTLTGKHITLRESDQYVTVDGPGEATFTAASGPVKAGEVASPPQHLKVNWLHSMDFNNTTGHANFHGQVVAGSDRGVDITRFQSSDLSLEIDPLSPEQTKGNKQGLGALIGTKEDAEKPAKTPQATAAKAKQPDRQIRKMVAKEKVVFEAEQWTDRVDGKLGTRFRLTGPLLNFDNTTGKLTVTGAGTMQIEDYRAKEKAKAITTDEKPASPVAFVGQGVTLFLWQSSLVIDANHNDVRMDKEVKMIQQPATGSEIIMQCNQLIADFQSTGGLNSWLTGQAGQPKLDNVTAAGNLSIFYQKQTVRGDQLYYTSNKQMAIISAEDGRMAELDTETTTLPARQFRWFLDKDRIVAEEPGAVRTKVGN